MYYGTDGYGSAHEQKCPIIGNMDETLTDSSGMSDDQDISRRFLFEEADIRGEMVSVAGTLRAILDNHQYAPGVARLIGEFVAAAALLSSTLKFEGRLTLQARSRGQVPLLMAECNNKLELRAIARGAQQATATEFAELIGEGQLAITVEPTEGQRYQSIVPLTGDSLAECLDSYFEQSEQLHTRVWLACNGSSAAGLLLQQLPGTVVPDPDLREQQWQHAATLAATVTADELLSLSGTDLLFRLYHQERVRLFAARSLRFHCGCSRERSQRALATLGTPEIISIIEEQGSLTMDCEFCNRRYVFTQDDLFPVSQKTLH